MAASFVKTNCEPIQNALLQKIEVKQRLNDHWWCTIECRQTKDFRFPIEQVLGQEIEVITVGQDESETSIFRGFILEAWLKYEVFGSFTACLTAVTYSYKMSMTPRKSYFLNGNLKDITATLASHSGLQARVEGPVKRSLNYVQWGESDFDFLNRLVDDHGCWLRPTNNGIEIHNSFQRGADLRWRDEEGLLEFSIKGTLRNHSFEGVHYHHHKMESKTFQNVKDKPDFFNPIAELVDAVTSKSSQMPSGFAYQRGRTVTLDEYETLLKKESVRSVGGSITGFGKSSTPALKPGDQVNITGYLDASGTYGIVSVDHTWTPAGYLNSFSCTPWKHYTDPEPPQPRQWNGLVFARVVEHNDPRKMGRIKVQYFWQEGEPTYWARMMTPHAGSQRGFMFMPEVGDEVVIGFEDGDPERPIVLGCLWNGVDEAPRQDFWDGDIAANDVKRIMTKSGHRMQFVDRKGKESITLATPKDLKISMIETTDETGRPMLTLHSENGDIFLSAPNGRIHLLSKLYSREVGDELTQMPHLTTEQT